MDLNNDDQCFQEYLKWKELPVREAFAINKNIVETHSLDRLCEFLKAKI